MIDIDYYWLSVYQLPTSDILTAWQPIISLSITYVWHPYSLTTSRPHYLRDLLEISRGEGGGGGNFKVGFGNEVTHPCNESEIC